MNEKHVPRPLQAMMRRTVNVHALVTGFVHSDERKVAMHPDAVQPGRKSCEAKAQATCFSGLERSRP